MIACYYQIDTINRSLERFRYIDIRTVCVPMAVDRVGAILPAILRDFCGVTAAGYTQDTETYWCKMDHRGATLLHVEIRLHSSQSVATQITISPHIGSDQIIGQFVSNFEESMQLYITSPFIRASLTDRWFP